MVKKENAVPQTKIYASNVAIFITNNVHIEST